MRTHTSLNICRILNITMPQVPAMAIKFMWLIKHYIPAQDQRLLWATSWYYVSIFSALVGLLRLPLVMCFCEIPPVLPPQYYLHWNLGGEVVGNAFDQWRFCRMEWVSEWIWGPFLNLITWLTSYHEVRSSCMPDKGNPKHLIRICYNTEKKPKTYRQDFDIWDVMGLKLIKYQMPGSFWL